MFHFDVIVAVSTRTTGVCIMPRKSSSHKLYVKASEWAAGDGGRGSGSKGNAAKDAPKAQLAFDCCALGLTPVQHPVVTADGNLYDLLNILPYLKKHGTDPVTNKPLSAKQLFKVTMHKNPRGTLPSLALRRVSAGLCSLIGMNVRLVRRQVS